MKYIKPSVKTRVIAALTQVGDKGATIRELMDMTGDIYPSIYTVLSNLDMNNLVRGKDTGNPHRPDRYFLISAIDQDNKPVKTKPRNKQTHLTPLEMRYALFNSYYHKALTDSSFLKELIHDRVDSIPHTAVQQEYNNTPIL